MHSPLPDASALEAGIIEDEQPSRLSRVQDNVRHLLRTSRFGSVHGSPPSTPLNQPIINHGLATPPESPLDRRASRRPEVLPSPSTESQTSDATSTASTTSHVEIPGVLFPPPIYQRAVQQMAHQSTLFNTRAVAALNHPDLTDPSMAVYQQRKAEHRQRNAWKRPRHGRGYGRERNLAVQVGSSQCLLCVLAALLLAATVATYTILATTSIEVTPTFHILFILGTLLATIVFAHTLVRLFLFNNKPRSKQKVMVLPTSRPKPHRRHRHRPQHPQARTMPSLSSDAIPFVPATPIRVHMPEDEVRPDSREAEPTATVEVEQPESGWDNDVEGACNPPPAYGKWRGSVRANPDYLHWQAVRSPVDVDAPELPSPTYEEATSAERTSPPSYVTRESPARRRDVQDDQSDAARVQSQAVEPEMVEVRGVGFAV